MLGLAFIIAFIVYFIKATTWKGMIFHPIIEKLEGLPVKLKKPLFDCPICMTPWWGTVVYLVGHFVKLPEFELISIQRVVFTVFAASGINTMFLIVNKIYDTILTYEKETVEK